MIVKVIEVNQDTGAETFLRHSELADCFPIEADEEYHASKNEIERTGRVWIGGGAAPTFLLMRA